MSIELPDLAYAYEALVPVISEATMRTHHGKHHRGYLEKLNALVRDTDLAGNPLETIVREAARRSATDPAMVPVFNNAAQAWNHAFYWKSLRARGGRGPGSPLAARIDFDFGSYRAFAEAYRSAAAGHFGSGWAWLVADCETLRIVTTSNGDTPIIRSQVPLLAIDVWEHAYYLDYQERRAAYVAGVIDHLLDWDFAERNFERSSSDFVGDVIRASGVCLDAARIESVLAAHPAVAEAAVVGYPHATKGQGIYAFVRLRPQAEPGEDLHRELGQKVSREIGQFAVPDVIQWAPALPKTHVAMLERRILRNIAANDGSDAGDLRSLADPAVIDELISGRHNVMTTAK